jgi:hypothetical protein
LPFRHDLGEFAFADVGRRIGAVGVLDCAAGNLSAGRFGELRKLVQ